MATYSNIQEKINALNEFAKGWENSQIRVQKAIHDFGAENIYFIRWEYNSDTYTYHYYNAKTSQEFLDYTMSWIGESDAVLTNCLSIEEAVENNLFDMTEINNKWQNAILLNYRIRDWEYTPYNDADRFSDHCIGLKVVVKGGRKYNGEGILIGVRMDVFFGRYGNKHTTYTVVVYDKQQNMIGEANANYCTVVDLEQIKNDYNTYLENEVKSVSYGQKFNTNGSVVSFEKWLNKYKVDIDTLDKTGMDYPEEQKRQRKLDIEASYKRAEINRIKKWINEKRPDITDPKEIDDFAERIYKKNKF